MKYQLGDIVLILHSNEEGKVMDIINDQMLLIDVNGVSFPVYMDQVDFPYYKRFTEKKIVAPKKEKLYIDNLRTEKITTAKKNADGVWLTFLPVLETDEFGDELVTELKLHLVNHTDEDYQFNYQLSFFGKPDFELKNNIRPFEDFYLHDIPFSDLNDSPAFSFEFSLIEKKKQKADYTEAAVRLKPKQLFAKIEELLKNNQATFSQLLFEVYPDKQAPDFIDIGNLQNKSNHIYPAHRATQNLEPARSVIDLHIEKLSESYRHLSNFEILSLQLKTFEKYYHLAIAHHLASMIVIHGVGEGVLRNEIHDSLRLKKEVKSFVNQYHPRYGYGATEIYFQY